MTTWREEITEAMQAHGETWADVVAMVGDESFDVEFDSTYGRPKGEPFTVWTANRVYFPHEYDGAESCQSVSRNPDGIATQHIPQ